MLVASWNVNGIRAVARKNLLPWEVMDGVDIWCLQETKARPAQVAAAIAEPDGWHSAWVSANRPGYSGVAIFSRQQPDAVEEGLGEEIFDDEGRVLSVRFDDLLIVSAYFPNSQEAGKRLDYKLAFCRRMETWLAEQREQGLRILLTGDYNIAHAAIDLARPAANEGNPGYLPEERAWMSHYLGLGYHDIFREENPELTAAYSWWSYRARARNNNVGWRIDYCTCCPNLRPAVSRARIHPDIMGSDHCPVSVEVAV